MKLLISSQYLFDTTPIDDNVDMDKLTPVIEAVQFLKIRPLLGTNLYNLILSQVPDSLSADNQVLVDDYLLPCMRNFILSDAVMVMKFRFQNTGIMVKNTESSTQIDTIDTPKLMDYWKNKAEEYGQVMIDFIKANPTLYPTYLTNTGGDQKSPNQSAFNVDIYLPDSFSDGLERI